MLFNGISSQEWSLSLSLVYNSFTLGLNNSINCMPFHVFLWKQNVTTWNFLIETLFFINCIQWNFSLKNLVNAWLYNLILSSNLLGKPITNQLDVTNRPCLTCMEVFCSKRGYNNHSSCNFVYNSLHSILRPYISTSQFCTPQIHHP